VQSAVVREGCWRMQLLRARLDIPRTGVCAHTVRSVATAPRHANAAAVHRLLPLLPSKSAHQSIAPELLFLIFALLPGPLLLQV
jgi:hypothetical protein